MNTSPQTPALIIDLDRIKANYYEIEAAFTSVRIAYAIKSNPAMQIIDTLHNSGSSFEVASVPEIEFLLSRGVSASDIVFSNPVKSRMSIAAALNYGVTRMSFDSADEVKKFSPHTSIIEPVFRIQVPNEGSLWPLTGKFGASRDFWPGIFQVMHELRIPVSGITFHVGSQCEKLTTWDVAMSEAYDAFMMAREFGLNPHILNIGGGFPTYLGREVPNVKEIAEIIFEQIAIWQKKGLQLSEIIAEPGRFISGSAGTLVTRIVGKAERDNGTWVFLDTGVFTGLMETIDGITYPVLSNGSGELKKVILCGPSCDSVDTMYETELPDPEEGDLLYLQGAGAYTTVYASNFNGFGGPAIEYLQSDSFKSNQPV